MWLSGIKMTCTFVYTCACLYLYMCTNTCACVYLFTCVRECVRVPVRKAAAGAEVRAGVTCTCILDTTTPLTWSRLLRRNSISATNTKM